MENNVNIFKDAPHIIAAAQLTMSLTKMTTARIMMMLKILQRLHRRRFQNHGRGIASYGRKEKVLEERVQMVLDDDNDEELTWHSLPTRVT